MVDDEDPRETMPGENLAREWDEERWAGSLWDALEIGESDPDATIAKLRSLADKGSALSMFYLGEYYTYGWQGVSRDWELAQKWLKKGASKGSIAALYLLARHYEAAEQYQDARNAYEALAEREYSPALYALGFEHYKGAWLEKDIQKAIAYLKEAKDLGHFFAARELSHIYRTEDLGFTKRLRGWFIPMRIVVPFVRCRLSYPNSDRLKR